MAPNWETVICSGNTDKRDHPDESSHTKPPRLSLKSLQRTISDISTEISEEIMKVPIDTTGELPATLPEVQDAKCECCGMSEECTADYIGRVQAEFSGKLVCGLCSAAVRERLARSGGQRISVALEEHMSACMRFNRIGRAYPVLSQAEAMREILKKRSNSTSPQGTGPSKLVGSSGGLKRTSSCIPAMVTREVTDKRVVE